MLYEFELAKKYCDSVEKKIIFYYLLNKFPVYSSIDEISKSIGVSNVTVTIVLKDMVREGYVGRKQINPTTAENPLYGYGVEL